MVQVFYFIFSAIKSFFLSSIFFLGRELHANSLWLSDVLEGGLIALIIVLLVVVPAIVIGLFYMSKRGWLCPQRRVRARARADDTIEMENRQRRSANL